MNKITYIYQISHVFGFYLSCCGVTNTSPLLRWIDSLDDSKRKDDFIAVYELLESILNSMEDISEINELQEMIKIATLNEC